MKRSLLTFAVLTLALTGCGASVPRSIETQIEKLSGGSNSFKVSIHTQTTANQAAVWKVLTDYDHHAEYLPYLLSSKMVYHNEEYKVIDQHGQFKLLFWTFAIHVKQRTREVPPDVMTFQAIDGDFTQLEGQWRLSAKGQGTGLFVEFRVQPRRRVPGWAMKMVARRYLAQMVHAICERAEKLPA
jgi:ribosome-associated toxin RatA of RatAB toxin-antitoxin module